MKTFRFLRINEELMREIKPDLIISQDLCSVCSPYVRETKTTSEILGYSQQNHVINPKNLLEVIESITTIGNVIGNLDQSYNLRNKIQLRLDEIGSIMRNKRSQRTPGYKRSYLCIN